MKVARYLTAAVKHALGLHHPGRNLLIFPDDVFLVSFPKSGNTWARFLICNLLHEEQNITFANIGRFIPDLDGGATKRDFERMPRPRIIKSHDCFDTRFPRVIYIVRDPRDVVVSLYHYQRKRRKIADDCPLEEFAKLFLAGTAFGNQSWKDNVVSWVGSRQGDPRFLLLRYEDMIADTARELSKIVTFLGVNSSAEQVRRAVERSSAGRMRKMEEQQTDQSGLMRGSRTDVRFVRSAKTGDWRSELPPPLIAAMEAAWGSVMQHLGYELSTADVNPTGAFPIRAAGGISAR